MLSALPLLLPVFVISLGIAVAVGPRLGRWFRATPLAGALLVTALGIIGSATLTPFGELFDSGSSGTGICDLSRLGTASPQELVSINDRSLNIALFVPLGLAVALLPHSRRTFALGALAVALPFAIELVQLVVTQLHRG